MNQYLIPANSKRSSLIFGLFRTIDLIIACIGVAVTFILMLIIPPDNLVKTVIVLLPLLICSFLVIPVANYHNMLCVIQNIINFYFNDINQYHWCGWRAKDEFK